MPDIGDFIRRPAKIAIAAPGTPGDFCRSRRSAYKIAKCVVGLRPQNTKTVWSSFKVCLRLKVMICYDLHTVLWQCQEEKNATREKLQTPFLRQYVMKHFRCLSCCSGNQRAKTNLKTLTWTENAAPIGLHYNFV